MAEMPLVSAFPSTFIATSAGICPPAAAIWCSSVGRWPAAGGGGGVPGKARSSASRTRRAVRIWRRIRLGHQRGSRTATSDTASPALTDDSSAGISPGGSYFF